MKGRILILLTAVFLSVQSVSPIVPSAESQDECFGAWTTVGLASGWTRPNVLRGRGTANNLRDVLLFAAEFSFNSRCGEPDIEVAVLREIAWNIETTIPVSAWQEVFLVLDDNANFKFDAEEKRFPVELSSGMLYARNLDIRVKYQERKNILLMANLVSVREKEYVGLKFADPKFIKAEPEGKTLSGLYSSVVFGPEIFHYRGNMPPELAFQRFVPYSDKSAVFPAVGSPQEEFEFSVVYRDEDGDKPSRAEVWIDENGNGQFEPSERHPMLDQTPGADFREFHTFTFKKSFAGSKLKGLKFRFYFTDTENSAVMSRSVSPRGFNPASIFEIRFEQTILVEIGGLRKDGYLPGEIIPVSIGVLVHSQGAYDINWQEFRGKINPRPFILKGLAVGERNFYDDIYDREEAILFLEAPGVRVAKEYIVKLPALLFVAKVDGRPGKIAVPSFRIPVTLKSRTEGPFVDQTAVRVGEPITYRVRNVRLVGDARPQELEKLTFKPFVEAGREIKTAKTENIIIEDFIFTLMLFEDAGEYQIPAFNFPFGKLAGFKVTLLPSKGADKLTLPYNERGLRLIPSSSKETVGKVLFAGSILALFVILCRPLWQVLRLLAKFRMVSTWQDRVREAHASVRKAVALAKANPCRETLEALYDRIRFYLIVIADAAASGKFVGADARTLRNALTDSVDRALLDAFVELEDSLMSSGRFEAEELLAKLDQTTYAMYAQLN